MNMRNGWMVGTAAAAALMAACTTTQMGGSKGMSFFVTSVGSGKGADLGGIAGADAHCQSLAKAAGAGDRTWRAYLSTQAPSLPRSERRPRPRSDRRRPVAQREGRTIASNVEELHSAKSNLTKETALDEKGQMVNGRTEKPNKHDMLTGSRPDGTAFRGRRLPT